MLETQHYAIAIITIMTHTSRMTIRILNTMANMIINISTNVCLDIIPMLGITTIRMTSKIRVSIHTIIIGMTLSIAIRNIVKTRSRVTMGPCMDMIMCASMGVHRGVSMGMGMITATVMLMSMFMAMSLIMIMTMIMAMALNVDRST